MKGNCIDCDNIDPLSESKGDGMCHECPIAVHIKNITTWWCGKFIPKVVTPQAQTEKKQSPAKEKVAT